MWSTQKMYSCKVRSVLKKSDNSVDYFATAWECKKKKVLLFVESQVVFFRLTYNKLCRDCETSSTRFPPLPSQGFHHPKLFKLPGPLTRFMLSWLFGGGGMEGGKEGGRKVRRERVGGQQMCLCHWSWPSDKTARRQAVNLWWWGH